MEEDLKGILEKISGAGNVSVRIYIDSTNEKILAADSKKQSETSEDKDGKKESSSIRKRTDYVVGRKPWRKRFSICCSGKASLSYWCRCCRGGQLKTIVRNEIYEAVKALYWLGGQ